MTRNVLINKPMFGYFLSPLQQRLFIKIKAHGFTGHVDHLLSSWALKWSCLFTNPTHIQPSDTIQLLLCQSWNKMNHAVSKRRKRYIVYQCLQTEWNSRLSTRTQVKEDMKHLMDHDGAWLHHFLLLCLISNHPLCWQKIVKRKLTQ